jgi:hypothetical protein
MHSKAARLPYRAIAMTMLVVLCLGGPSAQGAENERRDPGVIVRDSEVKTEPDPDAATTSTLRLGNRVEVSRLRGRWARVHPPDAEQGWIAAANVRISMTQQQSRGGGAAKGLFRGITGIVTGTGPSQDQGPSATVGIRGLTPEDVADAVPNPAERLKLDEYRATPDAAERYARDENLDSRSLAYFDEAAITGNESQSTDDAPESGDKN